MADAVASQTIMDGITHAVLKFTNISDATGEVAVVKVDPALLSKDGTGRACTDLVIEKMWYETVTMGVDILWDATANVVAFTLPKDHTNSHDFSEFRGIWNNAAAGKTGKIKFTTVGAAANAR